MTAEYVLLADSQPLFQSDVLHRYLTQTIRQKKLDTGMYIGASNQDDPAFYRLAAAAFQRLSLTRHYHLQATDQQALQIVHQPTVIILAGGNQDLGWQYLNQSALRAWLDAQQRIGSIFIGISAGALHLSSGLNDTGVHSTYLNWVNVATAVHEEADEWPSVKALKSAGASRILGIPFGEGIIAYSHELSSLHGRAFWYSDECNIKQLKIIPSIT